jgi:2-hydroxycyclohexanecarboxyl-CoA dehydrogenase
VSGFSPAAGQKNGRIVIAELDENQGSKVAAEIQDKGAEALFIPTDVTDHKRVEDMVKIAAEKFGRVDILVNNVGWTIDELFMEVTREKWEKVLSINLWGMLNCTRAVLDQMVERGQGTIVSLGSDAGKMGEFRQAVYSGSKGAVMAITKALAKELGKHGIRLNVVCPGLTVPESRTVFTM